MQSSPPEPRTSGIATASLVPGILSLFTLALTSIPAIICGHLARSQIRKSTGRVGGNGVAATGLTLGYLTAFVALAFVGFTAWMLIPPSDESGQVSRSKVEKFASRAGLVIPQTATATEYRWGFARDGQEYLKLEMPAADLGGFLTESGLDGELGNTTNTRGFDSIFGDFLPAHPKRFRSGQKSLPDGEAVDVLVDEESPGTVSVYLCRFGT
jgi:hypothetical protein